MLTFVSDRFLLGNFSGEIAYGEADVIRNDAADIKGA